MLNWIAEIITFPRIVAFVLGMLAGQGLSYGVNKYRVAKGKTPSPSTLNAVVGVVIIAAMVWIMVATQQARNCAISLNVAVANEQAIAKIERDSFAQAIQKSLTLPPDILALPQNDPRRMALTKPITDQYLAETARAAQMRTDNQGVQDAAKRACGTK